MTKVTLYQFSYFIESKSIQRWGTKEGITKISTGIFPSIGLVVVQSGLDSYFELEEPEVVWDDVHPGIAQIDFDPSNAKSAIEIPKVLKAQ